VVCDKSKFFKAACSKNWAEGLQRLVRLPAVKTKVFQDYCKWIYSGVIPVSRISAGSEVEETYTEQKLFVNLYLIGDLLDDIQLRNLATREMFAGMKAVGLPCSDTMARVCSLTPPGSLFRKMMVDCTVDFLSPTAFAESVATDPPEFVREVAIAAYVIASNGGRLLHPIGDGSQYLETEKPKVNTS
jgi:hypothetical protein